MVKEINPSPIQITPEQDAELDAMVDQGLTYNMARQKLGILPLDREVEVVFSHSEQSVPTPEESDSILPNPNLRLGNWKNDA